MRQSVSLERPCVKFEEHENAWRDAFPYAGATHIFK